MPELLVAVEPNEESQHIIATAAAVARQRFGDQASLHIVNVVRPIAEVYADLNFTPFAEHTHALFQEHIQQQRNALQAHVDHVSAASTTCKIPTHKIAVLEGLPTDIISRSAEQAQAPMVVMGLHNRHGISRLLGSTTYGVLNHAHCDLLAVHPGADGEQKKPGPYQRVLVCVDTSEHAPGVLAAAAAYTNTADAYQIISTVVPLTTVYASSISGRSENLAYNQIQENIEAQTRDSVSQAVTDAGLDADNVLVPVGDPRSSIIQTAKDMHADLIIMGSHRRGAIGRLLMGSTVRGVLDQSPCDVLITLG